MYDKSMIKSLKNKIYQLFILGFSGSELKNNSNFVSALENNLGGVIFFTENIIAEKQIIELIKEIKSIAKNPLIFSIDQEGGRVERTENIYSGKKKYLSARYIAEKGENELIKQTEKIAKELKKYGINMNFAPVADVNTNENNPIIGERAYSNKTADVSKYACLVAKTYLENGIIPVMKHFPGHGDTSVDSHLSMPIVDMDFEEFKKIHIQPFIDGINMKIPAIMVSHVHYTCFDSEKIPASISKKVVENYLINKLQFKGLIISDDMVMGGIGGYDKLEALIKATEAGVNMFIFRNSDDEIIELIEKYIIEVNKSDVLKQKIENSIEKITKIKQFLT